MDFILDDKQLWDQFRAGDDLCFELIYNSHIKSLIAYGRRINDDRELVVDCVQQLFTNLLDRRVHLGSTDSIKFYLFKSLRTIIIKEAHKVTSIDPKREIDSRVYEDTQLSVEAKLINEEYNEEQCKYLSNAIDKLSQREKEILYLKFYSGISNKEIAKLLSINYQSVKNTTSRAIQKLKKDLIKATLVVLLSLMAL